jgi:hypothetical protein
MKIPKRGKCSGCNDNKPVFRPTEIGDPELDNSSMSDDSSMNLSIRIPINCEECGSEMGRIIFDIEGCDIPDSAEIEWDEE